MASEANSTPISVVAVDEQQQSTPKREQANAGQQQQQQQQRHHQHRGGGGGGAGGRTPVGGRTIVNPTNRSSPYRNQQQPNNQQQPTPGRQPPTAPGRQQQTTTPGRQQQQPQPLQLHQSSGIPFGHIPAYLPGSASLVEQLDQRILIVLRDGKHLIGTLSSFDQFSNLILLDAIERRIVIIENNNNDDANDDDNMGQQQQQRYRYYYSDIPLGVYIVRGDSMVLAGDIQDDNYQYQYMEKVPMEQLTELSKQAIPPLEWDFDTDLTA